MRCPRSVRCPQPAKVRPADVSGVTIVPIRVPSGQEVCGHFSAPLNQQGLKKLPFSLSRGALKGACGPLWADCLLFHRRPAPTVPDELSEGVCSHVLSAQDDFLRDTSRTRHFRKLWVIHQIHPLNGESTVIFLCNWMLQSEVQYSLRHGFPFPGLGYRQLTAV